MCGIVGVFGRAPVAQEIYDALTVLQHRGQDAAGIATIQDERFFLRKELGLVRDVFEQKYMQRLEGTVGIGHVRYPTAGNASSVEAQPFYVNTPYGITLAHNGNLTNARELAKDIYVSELRHVNTRSDSEVLLNVLAFELGRSHKKHLEPEEIFEALFRVFDRCQGGYAVVCLVSGHGLIGFRDPHGIRPAVLGERHTPNGTEYMITSESVALDVCGYRLVRDLAPGEVIHISEQGDLRSARYKTDKKFSPCLFEYVYLARPDSIMDGVSVHQARLNMGRLLARKIKRDGAPIKFDVAIPIPDTSRTATSEIAKELGIDFREGFVKNRYIGRTFIMPGQALRRKSVRQKLNAIRAEFAGKHVLLVDDSIVRGTTSKEIIQMARNSGALSVSLCSAAPEVRYPNVYGIDMPSSSELIAYERTVQEICQLIGADWVVFQDLQDLREAVASEGLAGCEFDDSVFTGNYVTGDIDAAYLAGLAAEHKAGEGRTGAGATELISVI